MGEIYHEPLIVASFYDDDLAAARTKAVEVFESTRPRVELPFPDKHGAVEVGPIYTARYNGGGMFIVPSPGSKAGWAPSKDFEARVEEYITWMRDQNDWDKHHKKSLNLYWAWLCFGGDGMAAIRNCDRHERSETWGAPWGFVFGVPLRPVEERSDG